MGLRKVVTKESKKLKEHAGLPLSPYIPPEYSKTTRNFLSSPKQLEHLLEVVFSPTNAQISADDMTEMEALVEDNREITEDPNRRRQETRLEDSIQGALAQLPPALLAEGQMSDSDPPPPHMRYHQLYREAWFASLGDREKREFQVFQNLMHLRFPHKETKRRQPHLFWARINIKEQRMKEAAMKRRAILKRAQG